MVYKFSWNLILYEIALELNWRHNLFWFCNWYYLKSRGFIYISSALFQVSGGCRPVNGEIFCWKANICVKPWSRNSNYGMKWEITTLGYYQFCDKIRSLMAEWIYCVHFLSPSNVFIRWQNLCMNICILPWMVHCVYTIGTYMGTHGINQWLHIMIGS